MFFFFELQPWIFNHRKNLEIELNSRMSCPPSNPRILILGPIILPSLEGRKEERNINKEVSDESLSHIRTGIEMETSFGGWLFNETRIELTRHARLQFSTSPCSPPSLPQSHPTRLYLLLLHANSMRVSIDPGHPCIKGRVIVVIIMKGRDRQISMQPVEESRQRGGKAVDEGWNNVK